MNSYGNLFYMIYNAFSLDCKSIKCRKRLLLSQVKCIFALKESFFDRGKRKQNIVIRSFLNRYLILVKQK